MTELVHTQLERLLKDKSAAQLPGVCLIYGESLLAEQAVDQLLMHLLHGNSRDLNCDVVEGMPENIPEVLQMLNTYGLMGGPKVVVFKEAKVFESRSADPRLIGKIRECYENDDLPRAAKYFLSFCGRTGLDLNSVQVGGKVHAVLQALAAEIGPNAISQLAEYCSERAWSPGGTPQDPVQLFRQAIEKGFPPGHHLILTVHAKVPKNRKLYKAIQSCGLIVDCSVPQGQRRADKMAQEAILQQTMDKVLHQAGKQLAAGLFGSLCEKTGFDLRVFKQNLEKLIDYVGPRLQITAQDVEAVIERTKRDPIYDLTNAVADRNVIQALFYLDALLKAQLHPLQIVVALTNQIRRLLVAKDFLGSAFGRNWAAGMSYGQFQQQVWPQIKQYDGQISQQVGAWQPAEKGKGRVDSADDRPGADIDLYLSTGAKNPYAVYQMLLKSENFASGELVQAMRLLNQTDVRLKSSSQDAALILKTAAAAICRSER